jgi:hypothetical protein
MLKKWVILWFAGVLMVALASCASSAAPSTTASTVGTPSSAADAERVFIKNLAPDFVSWVTVIRDRRANKIADDAVYAELKRLRHQWTGRQAPSARTQAFLDGWLTDLGTCLKYWALLAKNDTAGAQTMRTEVDQAIGGAHLPETLAALFSDPRIGLDSATTVAP